MSPEDEHAEDERQRKELEEDLSAQEEHVRITRCLTLAVLLGLLVLVGIGVSAYLMAR